MIRNLRLLSGVWSDYSFAVKQTNNKVDNFKSCVRKLETKADMDCTAVRDAASLIIVSRLSLHDVVAKGKNLSNLLNSMTWKGESNQKVTDYRILMVKRSSSSSFMANAFVFPGGVVEVADFSSSWWPVFEKVGIPRKELLEFCSAFKGQRPPIVKSPMTLKSKNSETSKQFTEDYLPADIGLRIAALRETFEETGIPLLTNPTLETTQEAVTYTLANRKIDVHFWQKKVHDDPSAFVELCLQSGMCPDIWSLHEWSNWITPPFESRRYDTIFYVCCLPTQPTVSLDEGELTVKKWSTPEEMLNAYTARDLFLAPPQVYELSRILPLDSYHGLREFVRKREHQGCEHFSPLMVAVADGIVTCLPGDELYTDSSDRNPEFKEFSCSMEELRRRATRIHRMELTNRFCKVYCNITPACGHFQPVPLKDPQPQVQSSL